MVCVPVYVNSAYAVLGTILKKKKRIQIGDCLYFWSLDLQTACGCFVSTFKSSGNFWNVPPEQPSTS